MERRFWLLGSTQDLADVGQRMADAFGIRLAEHESYYRGGVYLRGSSGRYEVVIVQANFTDDDGDLVEADHPDCRTLVYVTDDISAGPFPSTLSGLCGRCRAAQCHLATLSVLRGVSWGPSPVPRRALARDGVVAMA